MPVCNLHQLKTHAEKFRTAIMKMKPELSVFSPQFSDFPRGCCGVTANLLAKYFELNGCGSFDIVGGQREKDRKGHQWLQQGSTIVDITATQFVEECQEPVLVITGDHWLSQFNYDPDPPHLADFEQYSDARDKYKKMFGIVMQALEL